MTPPSCTKGLNNLCLEKSPAFQNAICHRLPCHETRVPNMLACLTIPQSPIFDANGAATRQKGFQIVEVIATGVCNSDSKDAQRCSVPERTLCRPCSLASEMPALLAISSLLGSRLSSLASSFSALRTFIITSCKCTGSLRDTHTPSQTCGMREAMLTSSLQTGVQQQGTCSWSH